MKRLLVSAIYVGSGMAASFIVVVLLSRAAEGDARTGFFLFLALYFPLVALLSQTYALLRYRDSAPGALGFAVDLGLFAFAAGVLMVAGAEYFGPATALLYAATIPLTYRATARLAAIQFAHGSSLRHAAVPLGANVARVVLAGIALLTGVPVASAMVLSTLGFVALAHLGHTEPSAEHRKLQTVGRQTFIAFSCYFLASAFTFQWDRFAFSSLGADALLIAAGICMTWVLSPISGIYGVMSRAAAPAIFQNQSPGSPAELSARFMLFASQFTVVSGAFSIVLGLAWTPLNALVFPFYAGSALPAMILCCAMILDRIAMLCLLMRDSPAVYARAGVLKVGLIGISASLVLALPALQSLSGAFSIYLATSALYGLVVLHLCGIVRTGRASPSR